MSKSTDKMKMLMLAVSNLPPELMQYVAQYNLTWREIGGLNVPFLFIKMHPGKFTLSVPGVNTNYSRTSYHDSKSTDRLAIALTTFMNSSLETFANLDSFELTWGELDYDEVYPNINFSMKAP